MNLLLRLLWAVLFARFKKPCAVLGPCTTRFRVMPNDLDIFRHMNNGRYFTILDLARLDLMVRSGLARSVAAQGWYPVVVGETIVFRRSLKLWQRFDVETRVLGWDDKAFLLQQRFLTGKQEVAMALIRARFLKRAGGSVSPASALALTDVNVVSPELPDWARRWNEDQVRLTSRPEPVSPG